MADASKLGVLDRSKLTDLERFLMTTPDDTEDAPWMVMAELQVSDVDVLKAILRLHIRRSRLPWHLFSYLKITMRRPYSEESLDAAPDLLLAMTEDRRRRTSWNLRVEKTPPEFALEVSSGDSWGRDTVDKPRIYMAMGVREYAIFAPERKGNEPKLFGYHRDDANQWVAWQTDERGVLWSTALGGFGLYVEDDIWLRALDAHGNRLPTPDEWAEAEALKAEAVALKAEAARATAEAARAQAAEADARTAEAEAQAAEANARTAEANARTAGANARTAEAEARTAGAEAQAAAAARREAAELARREAAEDEAARLREELRRLRGEGSVPE